MSGNITDFSMDYFSLKGKTAIVTGANQGLGMAYATAFAKAGADLYIPHLTDDTEEIRKIIEGEGRKAAFIQGDLADRTYIDAVIAGCVKEYGKIDIIVNNAGISRFHEFEEFPDKDWEKCMDINLNAVYYLCHEAGKVMMKQNYGKIINIGSALSYTADLKCPPYVVAKHGIIGLTRWLANELGKYNIQANAICPGFLATEVNRELREDPEFYNKITNRIPAGRWGELTDLMGTAVYLASRASDYINGWNISIDGGFTTTL